MGSDLDEFTRLSPKYGLAGVAAASVVASLIGYAYLICALVKSGRWPRPLAWPRNFRSISRFLRFAGPVLLAVFLKMLVLANMTTAACSFGTTAAAAHQLFQTLFLLSAVAIGNPFSWAAQAFIPPILAAFCEGQECGAVSRKSFWTLRRLLASATRRSFESLSVFWDGCTFKGPLERRFINQLLLQFFFVIGS